MEVLKLAAMPRADDVNAPKFPSRRSLLALLAAGAAGLSAAPTRAAGPIGSAALRLDNALVLSGGGARGAYEAGVIDGLVRRAGIIDGQPLPGIDVVFGTSIGAINGWFVATGQYSRLRAAWAGISDSNLFRSRRRYASLEAPNSGLLTRVVAGLSLLSSLNHSLDGILDPEPIKAWLRTNIDNRVPVMPFVFNAADIRNMRAAYFYMLDTGADDPTGSAYVVKALTGLSGMRSVAVPSRPILHDALYASIALPLLLDPLPLVIDGVAGLFVDGGSSDNSAIDIARVVARRINAVFVDPLSPTSSSQNAVDAGLGSFTLLQQRVLNASMREAYSSTMLKRLFASSTVTERQRAFLDTVYDVDLRLMRPSRDLPSGIGDFHDATKVAASYQLGQADADRGWLSYEPTEGFGAL